MIKHIFLFFIFTLTLIAGVIKTPILSVDKSSNTATIKVSSVDVGVSGFVVHQLSEDSSIILKDVVVINYDKSSKIATLEMSDFNELNQNSLPHGNWEVEVGDTAILAFGYSRALLIAPNEEVYYRVTKATSQVQWLHPDIFATILSYTGHPTPLKEDFKKMYNTTSVGLVFFYINKKLFTVDAKTMQIINISYADLKQDSVKLPFYSRIDEIEANWWGEGSGELDEYEPYYYQLLMENNPNNARLKALYNEYLTKR